MPKAGDWNEPDIIVNGHALTVAQCMSVRVAISNFRMQLGDAVFRAAIGEALARSYDQRLRDVQHTMMETLKRAT